MEDNFPVFRDWLVREPEDCPPDYWEEANAFSAKDAAETYVAKCYGGDDFHRVYTVEVKKSYRAKKTELFKVRQQIQVDYVAEKIKQTKGK